MPLECFKVIGWTNRRMLDFKDFTVFNWYRKGFQNALLMGGLIILVFNEEIIYIFGMGLVIIERWQHVYYIFKPHSSLIQPRSILK